MCSSKALPKSRPETPNLVLHEGIIDDISFDADAVRATLADGRRVTAKLAVAADGRGSLARTKAGIGTRVWSYPQTAFTALLSHAKPHRNISTEFHTRSGPCTLVPLCPAENKPNRSSLVWLMSPAAAERRRALSQPQLAQEIEDQVDSLLGKIEIDGPGGFFPMAGMSANRLVGHRIALIGEAAHIFPPLAAQGLNLSLRDSAALAEVLEDARVLGHDIGSMQTLKAYADRAPERHFFAHERNRHPQSLPALESFSGRFSARRRTFCVLDDRPLAPRAHARRRSHAWDLAAPDARAPRAALHAFIAWLRINRHVRAQVNAGNEEYWL